MNYIDELEFPIITISNNKIVSFAKEKKDILICSKIGFRKGFYDDLNIIDSNGKSWTILKAKKVRTVGFFWGYSLLYGQRIEVQLEFKNHGKDISISDFKKKITYHFNLDKYFWNSDGELNSRFKFIENAISHYEIINYLTCDFFSKAK